MYFFLPPRSPNHPTPCLDRQLSFLLEECKRTYKHLKHTQNTMSKGGPPFPQSPGNDGGTPKAYLKSINSICREVMTDHPPLQHRPRWDFLSSQTLRKAFWELLPRNTQADEQKLLKRGRPHSISGIGKVKFKQLQTILFIPWHSWSSHSNHFIHKNI